MLPAGVMRLCHLVSRDAAGLTCTPAHASCGRQPPVPPAAVNRCPGPPVSSHNEGDKPFRSPHVLTVLLSEI